MDDNLWMLVAVGIVIIFFGIIYLVILKTSKKKRPFDYFSFFIMGMIWLVIGIPLKNTALLILGFLFSALGLIFRKKWDKNIVTWRQLTRKEKVVRVVIIIASIVILVIGVVSYILILR